MNTHVHACRTLVCLALLAGMASRANNITTTNGSLTGNTGTQVFVKFDVSWQNSWRIAPDRWDAAWIFVKYRTSDGLWQHAQLANAGHSASSGHTITTGLLDPGLPYSASTNYGVGVFLYRTSDGVGTVTATDVNLVWTYSNAGISMLDVAEVRVFAIEMVSVPQGAFSVGSGGDEVGSFTNGSWTAGATIPLSITSENAITIGQTAGNLWGTSSTGNSTIGPIGTLAAAFPKGFAAFYCMKYEVSQQGYVDFLNTLTYTQQATRTANAPSSAGGTGALHISNNNRNGIDIQTPGFASSVPAQYACNLDGDGIYGEVIGDGTDLACNHLSWGDLSAYLDWSGLRPMTELEFEKACRGTNAPVANEYPWGTTGIAASTYTLANAGTDGEGIATNYSTTSGNAAYTVTTPIFGAINGPVHVGCFANNVGNSGRVTAGASFYGIMELGGNVFERPVTIGNATGRAFTGTHGNGVLVANGDPDAATWPAPTTASGTGFRGGAWNFDAADMRVSERVGAASTGSGRNNFNGGRGARLAP